MGIETDLRRLVEASGARVLADPDHVRAALDDVLDEKAAGPGEINLLVDTVRLGAVRHLGDLLSGGAAPERAVTEAAERLAVNRGTSDVAGAAWAVSVMGFATGDLEADQVRARPLGRPTRPDDLGLGDPLPDEMPTRPPAVSTVRRPPSVVAADDVAPAAAPAAATRSSRRWRVPVAVAAVVLLLLAGTAVVYSLDRGDGDRTATDRTEPDVVMDPVADTGARLTVDPSTHRGVRSSRTYALRGDALTSSVVLTNTTRKPVERVWVEVVPKRLARRVDQVDYRPAYDGIIRRDPIVYWQVRIPAGGQRRITWSTPRPADDGEDDALLRDAIGWHADEVVATRATVDGWVRRNLPEAADDFGVAVPDTDSIEGSDQPTPVDDPAPVDVPSGEPDDDPDGGTVPLPTQPVSSPQPTTQPSPSQPPPPPPNTPTSFSLANRSSDEQQSVGFSLSFSDPDGVQSVRVSGLPSGVGFDGGRSVSGYLSHAAVSLGHSQERIYSDTRTVTVTVTDRRGQTRSGSFRWTIRDTHWVMPNYVGSYGNSPSIGPRFTQSFSRCYSESGTASTVARQSISPGTVIAYGARATFVYRERDSSAPAC